MRPPVLTDREIIKRLHDVADVGTARIIERCGA